MTLNQPAPPGRVDPVAIVAQIRSEVAARRAAGGYPEDLLRRLEVEFTPGDAAPAIEALAHIDTTRILESRRAVIGPAVVVAKKLVRRSIAWYVRPIAEEQTRFNFAAVRRIAALEARVAELERAGTDDGPAGTG